MTGTKKFSEKVYKLVLEESRRLHWTPDQVLGNMRNGVSEIIKNERRA